jgi:putative membrane protein
LVDNCKGAFLKRFLLRTLITAAAIFVVVNILPGVKIDSPVALIVTAILLGLLNAVLRPLLIFLTLPITVLSFGLFIFIINGLILYLVSYLVPGFKLANFWVAILASILISIVSWLINWLISDVSTQRNY